MHRYQRFLAISLCATLLPLLGVAAFTYTVDPFQQYRVLNAPEVRYPRAFQRYINPGIAKTHDYDFVITGSSFMENYDLGEVAALCKARPINLATSAMNSLEQRNILEVALRHRRVKTVVMTLDYNSLPIVLNEASLPVHLYDTHLWNDVRYLLSASILRRSIEIVSAAHDREGASRNPNRAWNWEHEVTFSRASTAKGIDPKNINARFRVHALNAQRMRVNFERDIAQLVEQHPDTQFNIIFPPYSILVWADYKNRGDLDTALDFKAYLVSRIGGLNNVRLYDFQPVASITHNLDRYKDIYHFDPAVNLEMMRAACHGEAEHRLTHENVGSFIATLRQQSLAADASVIVGLVK